MSTRLCKRCSIEKDVSLFPIDKRNLNWTNNICKHCHGVRNNLNGKPFKKRRNWLRRGWPIEEVEKAEAALQWIKNCQICGNDKHLHADHNHVTNVFRGILCHKCNRAMGFFNDDPERLRKAADYVDKTGRPVYN